MAKYFGVEEALLTSSSSVVTSSKVSNPQRYDVLYLRSSMASNNGDNILGEVYCNNSADLSMIRFDTPDAHLYSVALANNNTNSFSFSLVDKDGIEVNLNGLDWRCVISLFTEC